MVENWAVFAHSSHLYVFLGLVCFLAHGYPAQKTTEEKYFTNGWAIKVSEPGGHEKAKEIAKRHGFDQIFKVCFTTTVFPFWNEDAITSWCQYSCRSQKSNKVPKQTAYTAHTQLNPRVAGHTAKEMGHL